MILTERLGSLGDFFQVAQNHRLAAARRRRRHSAAHTSHT